MSTIVSIISICVTVLIAFATSWSKFIKSNMSKDDFVTYTGSIDTKLDNINTQLTQLVSQVNKHDDKIVDLSSRVAVLEYIAERRNNRNED